MSGNANEIGDVGESPGKSSLFFLTVTHCDPGIGLSGDRVNGWESSFTFELSGALSTALENPSGRDLFAPLVVLITASGLQGEQPLVDRTM